MKTKTARNKLCLLSLLALVCLCRAALSEATNPISLAGAWRFQLDRADVGVAEQWFKGPLHDTVKLPGVLAAQGIGDDVGLNTPWTGGVRDPDWFKQERYAPYAKPDNFKFPFWLQPDKYYAGAAWYQRDITIPRHWQGSQVVLTLERPHWETRLWLDGQPMGTNDSLSTPHEYALGPLAPGHHTLTIRVDNRMIVDVGWDSHSVSDHTQGNWNGIAGRIELQSRSPSWIDQQRIFPGNDGTVRVEITVRHAPGFDPVDGVIETTVREKGSGKQVGQARVEFHRPRGNRSMPTVDMKEIVVRLDSPPRLWSEFSPELYEVVTQLEISGGRPTDVATESFGFREISAKDTQFTINGRQIFVRGTLSCCIFPKTGHPPTGVAEWKRIIGVAKAHGLNLIRFHSWCPPEAAFVAADELGFYLHVEGPSWARSLGDGTPLDPWLYEETDRILKHYGNHPSFILMLYGNEPGGRHHADWLARWVNHYKAKDPRRLWSSGAGWPQLAENQWHCTPNPRVQAWGQGLKSRINAKPPETRSDYRAYIQSRTVPVVSHEIGQWCVYPNFDEMKKYNGYLKPKNFEIFRDTLNAHGMGHLAKQFLLASGKLQTLCYKEDIESALRTPAMGGFELLDLHDFPGQGTALVGVLDPFWEEKGYVTPGEYSRFCNQTVPLARLSKRIFTTEERLEADIEVAHFGPAPLSQAAVDWRILSDTGETVAAGQLPRRKLAIGNGIALGKVSVDLTKVPAPARYKLSVRLGEISDAASDDLRSNAFENDWDVWVYPAQPAAPPADDILVAARFDDKARTHLAAGGKLLLTIPGRQVGNFDAEPVKLGFSSIFWNTAWTQRQAPTTLGILCDPKHPALEAFPTEFHSNWQWWYLLHRAGALRLDRLPKDLDPIVRIIDDWFTARPLGLVIEAGVGAGKVVICGFDLTRGADDPVSLQLRSSLLNYMNSDKFAPRTTLRDTDIESLFAPSSTNSLVDVRRITASSVQEGFEAVNAIDGDPSTFWHSTWEPVPAPPPHELVIEFNEPRTIAGFTALPRQDGNRNGWISNFAVHVSADGRNWGRAVSRGIFKADQEKKTVHFTQPVTGRFIKLVALGGHAKGSWASLAEFDLIPSQ